MHPAIWVCPPACSACCKPNDSRHDHLRAPGPGRRRPVNVAKRRCIAGVSSNRAGTVSFTGRDVTAPPAETPEAPGRLLARNQRTDRCADWPRSGQHLRPTARPPAARPGRAEPGPAIPVPGRPDQNRRHAVPPRVGFKSPARGAGHRHHPRRTAGVLRLRRAGGVHPRADRRGHLRGIGRRPRLRHLPRAAAGDDRRADPQCPRPADPAGQHRLPDRPAARR